MKPYYDEAGITIYHGDCREVIPGLDSDALLLTDPPWGARIKTDNAARGRGMRPYDRFARAVDFAPVRGDEARFSPVHLLGFGSAVIWGANHFSNELPTSPCWFVWDRKTERGAASDITDCELAWTRGLRYSTVRIFRHMWAGFQRDSEVGDHVLHPMQKPIALAHWCLGFFPDCSLVVDPYCGSGGTLVAAKVHGRRAIGIEIEERYCEIAANRLRQGVLFGVTP